MEIQFSCKPIENMFKTLHQCDTSKNDEVKKVFMQNYKKFAWTGVSV